MSLCFFLLSLLVVGYCELNYNYCWIFIASSARGLCYCLSRRRRRCRRLVVMVMVMVVAAATAHNDLFLWPAEWVANRRCCHRSNEIEVYCGLRRVILNWSIIPRQPPNFPFATIPLCGAAPRNVLWYWLYVFTALATVRHARHLQAAHLDVMCIDSGPGNEWVLYY